MVSTASSFKRTALGMIMTHVQSVSEVAVHLKVICINYCYGLIFSFSGLVVGTHCGQLLDFLLPSTLEWITLRSCWRGHILL